MFSSVAKSIFITGLMLLSGWSVQAAETHSLKVKASAYNSLPGQTEGDPTLAAWGDRLEPGMKVIAVSRDLLEMGLDYKTSVQIKGLPGTYRVLDKMPSRWTRRIDIYMGEDVRAAREWGVRTVTIIWQDDSN